jgi:site-specific DNA-methyltransferase (adenine-specific)
MTYRILSRFVNNAIGSQTPKFKLSKGRVMPYKIHLGDSEKLLASYPDNHFTGCITDCNYGISFMNLKWDYQLPPINIWREALRTIVPGGKLLCFGSPRMFHRLACDLEDAGWEIQDCLCWLYGQGMPHGINIAKSISKSQQGFPQGGSDPTSPNHGKYKGGRSMGNGPGRYMTTSGVKDDRKLCHTAEPFNDYHSHLKPAWEPILLCSKPLGNLTYAEAAVKNGVSGLNIGATRIITKDNLNGGAYSGGVRPASAMGNTGGVGGKSSIFENGTPRPTPDQFQQPAGRWPANVLLSHHLDCKFVGYKKVKAVTGGGGIKTPGQHGIYGKYKGHEYNEKLGYFDSDGNETIEEWECCNDCPVRVLDHQTSHLKAGKFIGHNRDPHAVANKIYGAYKKDIKDCSFGDSGGASRFFYVSKVSRNERNFGCDELYWKKQQDIYIPIEKAEYEQLSEDIRAHGNIHQTVKPVNLLDHLVKLLSMPNNKTHIIDPFMGSGTTGIACLLNEAQFTGIDIQESSVIIAESRLNAINQPLE